MVAIMDNNKLFERSRSLFEKGELSNSLESFEQCITNLGISKPDDQTKYVQLLKEILEHCRSKELMEEEARVLRLLGRAHSVFGQHYESLNYHRESLAIQRKLGRKSDFADGLVLLADTLEMSGKHDESIESLKTAIEIFREMGKLRKAKEINKEITRLEKFSQRMDEDEYLLRKFNIDY